MDELTARYWEWFKEREQRNEDRLQQILRGETVSVSQIGFPHFVCYTGAGFILVEAGVDSPELRSFD